MALLDAEFRSWKRIGANWHSYRAQVVFTSFTKVDLTVETDDVSTADGDITNPQVTPNLQNHI